MVGARQENTFELVRKVIAAVSLPRLIWVWSKRAIAPHKKHANINAIALNIISACIGIARGAVLSNLFT